MKEVYKLYKVKFVRQNNGNEKTNYVLADDMKQIEDEYADIISVEPIPDADFEIIDSSFPLNPLYQDEPQETEN